MTKTAGVQKNKFVLLLALKSTNLIGINVILDPMAYTLFKMCVQLDESLNKNVLEQVTYIPINISLKILSNK